MRRNTSLPWTGFGLAAIAGIVMLTAGISFWLVMLVMLIWVGSLWLVGARPPDIAPDSTPTPFTADRVGDLIEHSDTPILVTRRNRISIANAAARRLFGTHVVEQDIRMALRHPEAIALLESGESGSAVIRGLARRRDIWRVNRKDIDGELGVLEFINRTNEADISRAHTDFVANASHELRTPLAAIIGYVETLRDDAGKLDSERSAKFLDTIHREARRLQDLVSDLMSLSRIEAEKHDRPEDLLALGPLVERAARDVAGGERGDRLELAVAGEFPIRGDAQQLEQMVRNLVDNAFKYGDDDRPVTVNLEVEGESRVRLMVHNEGEGIAAEHLPHLTRRFYRTDPGRSRASGGTGLGLAIVKHIVERHRGRLGIESKLGEGTSVKVLLPLSE
ncbi:ATP-binding protein [Qipengyuania sp. MTN3-11]|uniref:ATP-binding protein n=1 Tax=Qipengyuania sp. MTN3-11 TaxID=3056557 RepID=UPI0036F20DE1